jgi:hypothetical protein
MSFSTLPSDIQIKDVIPTISLLLMNNLTKQVLNGSKYRAKLPNWSLLIYIAMEIYKCLALFVKLIEILKQKLQTADYVNF